MDLWTEGVILSVVIDLRFLLDLDSEPQLFKLGHEILSFAFEKLTLFLFRTEKWLGFASLQLHECLAVDDLVPTYWCHAQNLVQHGVHFGWRLRWRNVLARRILSEGFRDCFHLPMH